MTSLNKFIMIIKALKPALIAFLTIYSVFYIGYEILPDGWTSAKDYWWSFPSLLLLVTIVCCAIIMGVVFAGAALDELNKGSK